MIQRSRCHRDHDDIEVKMSEIMMIQRSRCHRDHDDIKPMTQKSEITEDLNTRGHDDIKPMTQKSRSLRILTQEVMMT